MNDHVYFWSTMMSSVFCSGRVLEPLWAPQVEGSSTTQGRSSGHRWRKIAAGLDELPGGVYTTCVMLLGSKL